MITNSNWKNVTRTQMGQVAPPSPDTAGRVEKATGDTAGDLFKSATDGYRAAENHCLTGCVLGLGAVSGGGLAVGLLARQGLPVLAGAAGSLGGALALTAGYFAMTSNAEAKALSHYRGELETWASQTQQHLVRPGQLPGTEENHNFFEAGPFKSVHDVRQNNVVIAREAELTAGLKLHEDIAKQTVTAHSVAGTQTFPRATLQLPCEGDRTLRLKTWSDEGTPVVQSLNAYGSSKVKFGDRASEVHVFPETRMDGLEGTELPGRTLRFEIAKDWGNYGQPTADVFYARPPLAGCDFSPNFPTFDAPITRALGYGQTTSRVRPEAPVERLKTHTEGLEEALQTRQLTLPGGIQLVENVGTGQVRVARDGQTLRDRPGKLDLIEGTLTEKQGKVDVCQDLTVYPRVAIKTGSHDIQVDTDDNVQARRAQRPVPARLSDGKILEVGAPDLTERLEIPVPRRA